MSPQFQRPNQVEGKMNYVHLCYIENLFNLSYRSIKEKLYHDNYHYRFIAQAQTELNLAMTELNMAVTELNLAMTELNLTMTVLNLAMTEL